MEFQALTGSVVVAVTQTVVALFMIGLYLRTRRDACTRYWAIASVLVAIGVIARFPFISTPFGVQSIALGNSVIVAGLVFTWWGMRAGIPRPGGIAHTFSIGIATGDRDSSRDALLVNADRALYAAKAAGRGRAMIA